MTTKQKTVLKKKPKAVDITEKVSTVFEWAGKELEKAAELFSKRKADIILETAKKLEDIGIDKDKISTEISKNLAGFVDDGYVRRVLKDYPQYKDKSRVHKPAKREKKESKKQEEEEPQLLEVENQTGDDDAPTGYYEMPVKDFKIKDIQLYDRQFLLEIVVHLFERLPEEVQKEYK